METVYMHHMAIYEAIEAQVQDEAEAAMTRHLEWARQTDNALKDGASRSPRPGVPS
jgi:DNA-binding FadR family transcriptional regulator